MINAYTSTHRQQWEDGAEERGRLILEHQHIHQRHQLQPWYVLPIPSRCPPSSSPLYLSQPLSSLPPSLILLTLQTDVVIIMLGSNDAKDQYWNYDKVKADYKSLINTFRCAPSLPFPTLLPLHPSLTHSCSFYDCCSHILATGDWPHHLECSSPRLPSCTPRAL